MELTLQMSPEVGHAFSLAAPDLITVFGMVLVLLACGVLIRMSMWLFESLEMPAPARRELPAQEGIPTYRRKKLFGGNPARRAVTQSSQTTRSDRVLTGWKN